ncbi:MAG: hypothetical protein V1722_03725 [Candidatus Micrarchaeota archaeon]
MRFERKVWHWIFALVIFLIGVWAIVQAVGNFAGGYLAFLPMLVGGLFFIVVVAAGTIVQPTAVEVKGNSIMLFMPFSKIVKLSGVKLIRIFYSVEGGFPTLFIKHSKGEANFSSSWFPDELLEELDKIKPIEVIRWPYKSKKLFERKSK